MAIAGKLVHVPRNQADARSKPENPQLAKWGFAGNAGYQLVPNVLFRAQKYLELDPVDVVILLNLSLHWWGAANLPFPSPRIIADRMSVSRRTIERRLGTLERRGFLKRLPAKAPAEGKPKIRRIELNGLVEKLETAARIGLAQREFAKGRRQAANMTKFTG
jgi:hypothetical protein